MKAKLNLLLAAAVVAASLAGGAAVAQAPRKTDMVDKGKTVDSLLLRYSVDATWVLDDKHFLFRDTYRDHYLVSFKEDCKWLDWPEPISFSPPLTDRVRASLTYEARNAKHGPHCDVERLEKLPKAAALEMIEKKSAG